MCEVTQSCPTLCDPMACSLPGSSVRRIFQAIVLEWIAISFSRGSSQGSNQGLPHCRQMLYRLSHQGSLPRMVLPGCHQILLFKVQPSSPRIIALIIFVFQTYAISLFDKFSDPCYRGSHPTPRPASLTFITLLITYLMPVFPTID